MNKRNATQFLALLILLLVMSGETAPVIAQRTAEPGKAPLAQRAAAESHTSVHSQQTQTAWNMVNACALCHAATLADGLGAACLTCHTTDSPHTLANCASCHNPASGSESEALHLAAEPAAQPLVSPSNVAKAPTEGKTTASASETVSAAEGKTAPARAEAPQTALPKKQKSQTGAAAGTINLPPIVPVVLASPIVPAATVPQMQGGLKKESVPGAAQPAKQQTAANMKPGPVLSTPANEAVFGDGRILFSWTNGSPGKGFLIQVSKTPQFTSRTIDAATPLASFKTASPLAQGTYYWHVKAKSDSKQNDGEWSDTWSFSIDTLAPANTTAKNFINGGSAETNSQTVNLAISAIKTNSVVGVDGYYVSEQSNPPKAGDPGWQNVATAPSYSSSVPFMLSSGDGMKIVHVWFKDSLGRVSNGVRGSVVLDSTPPHTTITCQPPAVTSAGTATFIFSSTKSQSTFKCNMDGKGFEACTSPLTYQELSEGGHSLIVKAVDSAGNIDPSPASFSWKIDRVAPRTNITSHPRALTRSLSASFGFDSSKPQSTFLCKLDGNSYERCTSPQTYQGLTPGAHTFSVKAVDAAGNVDEQPPVVAWSVDNTPFGTTLTDTPVNPSNVDSATFSFTADKEGALFECRLDDGEYAACKSPVTYAGLQEGYHRFGVRAVDEAGVEEDPNTNYDWQVNLPPIIKSPRRFLNKEGKYITYKNEVRVSMAAYSPHGVAAYYISEDQGRPDSTDPGWVNISKTPQQFSAEVPYTLSEGKGTKVVNVWFKDTVGTVTTAPATDSIYVFNSNYAILVLVLLQLAFLL